jgi:hypothetical protein
MNFSKVLKDSKTGKNVDNVAQFRYKNLILRREEKVTDSIDPSKPKK